MAVKFKKTPDTVVNQEPVAKIEVETKTGGNTLFQSYQEKLDFVLSNQIAHANVGFKAGVTRNMGDYNSARVDVSVFLPTAPTEEGIDAAYDLAKAWVDMKMETLLAELGAD